MNDAYMAKLPNEVWERILLRLVLKDLHEFSLTNKHFHSLVQTKSGSDEISFQCVNVLMHEYPGSPESNSEDKNTNYQAALFKAPSKWNVTWAQAKEMYAASQETAYDIHPAEEVLLCYAVNRFRYNWAIISIFMAQMIESNPSVFLDAVSRSQRESCAPSATKQRPPAHWKWIYHQFIDLRCVRMHRVKSLLRSWQVIMVF